jgi:Cu+-exporting ATPase
MPAKEGVHDQQKLERSIQEPTSQTVHDPVCHMDIIASSSAGNSEYEGKTYYFCSTSCMTDFNADPAGVLKLEAEYHGN